MNILLIRAAFVNSGIKKPGPCLTEIPDTVPYPLFVLQVLYFILVIKTTMVIKTPSKHGEFMYQEPVAWCIEEGNRRAAACVSGPKAVAVPRLYTWMPCLVILWHIRMGLSAF